MYYESVDRILKKLSSKEIDMETAISMLMESYEKSLMEFARLKDEIDSILEQMPMVIAHSILVMYCPDQNVSHWKKEIRIFAEEIRTHAITKKGKLVKISHKIHAYLAKIRSMVRRKLESESCMTSIPDLDTLITADVISAIYESIVDGVTKSSSKNLSIDTIIAVISTRSTL